jgi:hypothetical protein
MADWLSVKRGGVLEESRNWVKTTARSADARPVLFRSKTTRSGLNYLLRHLFQFKMPVDPDSISTLFQYQEHASAGYYDSHRIKTGGNRNWQTC